MRNGSGPSSRLEDDRATAARGWRAPLQETRSPRTLTFLARPRPGSDRDGSRRRPSCPDHRIVQPLAPLESPAAIGADEVVPAPEDRWMRNELDSLDLLPSHLVAIPEWKSEADEAIIHGGDRSAQATITLSWPRSRPLVVPPRPPSRACRREPCPRRDRGRGSNRISPIPAADSRGRGVSGFRDRNRLESSPSARGLPTGGAKAGGRAMDGTSLR